MSTEVILQDLSKILKGADAFSWKFHQRNEYRDRELPVFSLDIDYMWQLCERHGISNLESFGYEAILIRVEGVTRCRLTFHVRGTFMVLGPAYGAPVPHGGILTARWKEEEQPGRTWTLVPEHKREGDVFTLDENTLHAFFADEGSHLDILGFMRKLDQNHFGYQCGLEFGYVLRQLGRVDAKLLKD